MKLHLTLIEYALIAGVIASGVFAGVEIWRLVGTV